MITASRRNNGTQARATGLTGTGGRAVILTFFFLFTVFAAHAYAGTLTGKIVDAMSMGGVAGAQVNVYDSGNVLVAQLSSAADGTFSQAGLSGHYTVRVSAAGYSPSVFTASVDAGTADMGNLLIVPQAMIRVFVKDNASISLPNGTVRVVQNGNEVVARLDGASGDIYVSAGDYEVIFSAPFHTEQSFHVSLVPAGTVTLVSALEPTSIDTSPVVQSVTVSLGSQSVGAGTEVTLNAIATYTNGHVEDVTAAAVWDAGSAGTIYLPTLLATSAGNHTIRATFGGKSGTSVLSVGFGQPRSLSVNAAPASAYTGEPVTLTSTVVDQYGNAQVTTNVNYSTTCGSIQNGVLYSQDACTAVVTAVSNANTSLTGTVSVAFTKKDSRTYEPSSRKSSTSGGGATSTSNVTDSGTGTIIGSDNKDMGKPLADGSVLKFVFPDVAYVNSAVEVSVLDSASNKVDGVVIVVVMPDGRQFSLVTSNGGKITFIPATAGDYTLKSNKYVISGANTITVKEVPLVVKPPIRTLDTSKYAAPEPAAPVADNNNYDMVGAILAAFSGDMSPADAIKATMPLWTILGALIFAAAIFFVIYTFMAGNAQPHSEEQVQAGAGQKVQVAVSKGAVSPEAPTLAPAVSKPPAKVKAVKEPSRAIDSEIASLEDELKEKMARLKRLKEQRGY